METGNANVAMSAMTSPGVAAPAQWMQYGAGIVPRQSKWYPNGHMSSNGVAIFDHMSPSPSLQTLPSSPAGYFSPLPRRTPTDGRSYSTAANAMLQQQQHQVNMPLPVAGGIDESGDFMPKFPPPMFDCIPDIADSNSVYEFVDADAASRQRHYPVMYHDLNHHNHTNHQLQLQQQHQQQQQQQQQQNYQQLHQLPPHRLQQQQQQVPVGPPTPGWSHQTPYWTSPPPQSLLLASSVGAGSLSSGRSNSSNSSPSASAGTCASSFNDDVIPTGHSSALPELGDMPILPPSGGVQQNNNTPTTNSSNAKRTKSPKKRKRRDPNEPQKPVSAYSLFFRNAQAAIKNRNPSATFGDVSKIVASMWDNLDENVKNYYKRQMEAAKKDYLKQLAVYRANLQATNNTSTSKNVSEDSAEATGSSNETEADQSNCSPPTSAVLLPSSGGGTGDVSREKTLSSPAEAGSMLQPSPAGQQAIPGTVAESISGAPMTSFHSGNGPAMHAHPATAAAMFGPANGYYEPPTTYILPETERYMRNHVTPPGAAFGRYPNNGYNYSNIRSSTASGYQLSPPPQQPTHHQPTAPVPFQTGLIPGHPQHYQQLQQKPFIAGHPSADFQLLA